MPLDGFPSDLRYSLRSLRRRPSFFLFAVAALALGVGANTAIFSVVDAVLLRPLQFRDSSRLVEIWRDASSIGFPEDTPSPGAYEEWTKRNHVFTEMAALKGDLYAVTGEGPAEQVEGSDVTYNLFHLLGVAPVVGRDFQPEEDRPGGAKVVMLSAGFWQRRFGGDPSVIGRMMRLNDEAYQIVGVMPAGFSFPERSDVWLPLALSSQELRNFGAHYLRVVGRLRPGIPRESAKRELEGLMAQIGHEHPNEELSLGVVVKGLREQLVGNLGPLLWVLVAGVGCVLLIACANLSGLLMARGVERRREMAVRTAMGATRGRLIRQTIVESLLLSTSGGAVGVLLAVWTLPLLRDLVPLALSGWTSPQLNWSVAVFSLGVTLLAGLLFGALPAWKTTRIELNTALQTSSRSIAAPGQATRRFLVVGEVALATALVAGAGLFLTTLWRLSHVDLGFASDHLLTLRTNLPQSGASRYRDFHARSSFYTDVLERVQNVPGVISAGYTTFLPLTNGGGTSEFDIEGHPPPPPGQVNDANHRVVSDRYFQAMKMRLESGRYFAASDGPDSRPVAIINQAMANQYWPGENPLEHRFKLEDKGNWITIVGVVNTIRQRGLELEGRAEMYFPCTQPIASAGYFAPRDLVVRTTGDPIVLASAVREAIRSVDKNQPVSDVMPMDDLIASKLAARDLQLKLLGGFAGISLFLAALGLYGLLDYTVVQRTKEIGIRMALGARKQQVLRAVLGEGLSLVLVGIAGGLAVAVIVQRAVASLLYGVQPVDLLTLSVTGTVLLVTGAAACALPAWRAAGIEPIEALRDE